MVKHVVKRDFAKKRKTGNAVLARGPGLATRKNRHVAPRSQTKRDTNFAIPGYEILSSAQLWSNMWSKGILRKNEKREMQCLQGAPGLRLGKTDTRHHAPKPSAIPTSLYPDIAMQHIIPDLQYGFKPFLRVAAHKMRNASLHSYMAVQTCR